jgi:glycosyltransferase involved in cell wall biosynthesis
MRIALCANGRSPHAQRWANALVVRGHEVAFVWKRDDLAIADLSSFAPSISHYHLPPASLRRPWTAVMALRAARRLAQRVQPQIVHGFYLSSNGLAANAMGVHPLVLTALGSDVLDLRRRGGGSIEQRVADAYTVIRTRAAVTSADVVLADSSPLAEVIRERVPGTVTRIVRFGVDVHRPPESARASWRRRLGIDDGALVLLSSRLVRPHYNIDTIIRALAAIQRRLPNSVLILKELERFSDAAYRQQCLSLIDELGVRDAVRMVGEVDRRELLELHTAADIYVSVPATDGTAVSVLEAMAAGVAIVATDAPGIDPVIMRRDETALLVPIRDSDALASAVVELGLDPERRRTLVDNAHEVVRLYGDFDRELDRATMLYEELIATSKK